VAGLDVHSIGNPRTVPPHTSRHLIFAHRSLTIVTEFSLGCPAPSQVARTIPRYSGQVQRGNGESQGPSGEDVQEEKEGGGIRLVSLHMFDFRSVA